MVIDDYDRPGEQNTVELMKRALDEHGVAYLTGVYEGQKTTCVIVSEVISGWWSL